MKKMSFIVAVLAISFTAVSCKKEVSVQQGTSTEAAAKEDIPNVAMSFLNNYYSNVAIAKYEVKNDVLGKSFEVKLNNGAEVEFNEAGKWNEISDPQGIDNDLVPQSIKDYVAKNYAGAHITKVKLEKKNIKIDLSNDVDLIFDGGGNFVKVDK